MRILLRILARLYPAAWRKRYGAEFEALIEDARPCLGGALDILKGAFTMQITSWSSSRVLAVSAVAGVLISTGIAFARPSMFSSVAVIQIPLAESLDRQTVEQVNTAANTALNQSSLTNIIRESGVYSEKLNDTPAEGVIVQDLVERLKRDIQISPVSGNGRVGFQVRFVYKDKYLAQRVVQAVVGKVIGTDPKAFRLMDSASLPVGPINPFSAKIATAGLGGGLLIGVPFAGFLYWRRRK